MNRLSRFSFTHVLRNSVSFAEIGYILQEKVSGASGLKMMAWSSCLIGGNRRAASSENTSEYSEYSLGIAFSFSCCLCASSAHCCATFDLAMCNSSSGSRFTTVAMAFPSVVILLILARFVASSLVVLTVVSPETVAFLQLTSGSKVCSHGNPKIARSFPRLVMKNSRISVVPPQVISKLVYLVSSPSTFLVPSTLVTVLGISSGLVLIPSLFAILLSMKLCVAPLSSSASSWAFLLRAMNVNGTCIAVFLLIYMRSVLIALVQALGFERFKNPLPGGGSYPVCLLFLPRLSSPVP